MSISWSDWKDINHSANCNQPAIYRIRLAKEGKPVQICRFLGTDKDGILCIGKTTNMDSRRKQFIKALIGTFGHSEGNLLQILEQVSPLTAIYPDRQYEYSFSKVLFGKLGLSRAKSKSSSRTVISALTPKSTLTRRRTGRSMTRK